MCESIRHFDESLAKFGSVTRLKSGQIWLSSQRYLVSGWQRCGKPHGGTKLRRIPAGRAAHSWRSSYRRCSHRCGAKGGGYRGWPDLFLHREAERRTCGSGGQTVAEIHQQPTSTISGSMGLKANRLIKPQVTHSER